MRTIFDLQPTGFTRDGCDPPADASGSEVELRAQNRSRQRAGPIPPQQYLPRSRDVERRHALRSRIGRVALDGAPQDAVELVLVGGVDAVQVEAQRRARVRALRR